MNIAFRVIKVNCALDTLTKKKKKNCITSTKMRILREHFQSSDVGEHITKQRQQLGGWMAVDEQEAWYHPRLAH